MITTQEAVDRITEQMIYHCIGGDAYYLGGSIRWGFERPESDVDIYVCISRMPMNKAQFKEAFSFNEDTSSHYEANMDGRIIDCHPLGPTAFDKRRATYEQIDKFLSYQPFLVDFIEAQRNTDMNDYRIIAKLTQDWIYE